MAGTSTWVRGDPKPAGLNTTALPASGRRLPVHSNEISVYELASLYLEFADRHYRKNGEPTRELANIKAALRPLLRLYGVSLAALPMARPKRGARRARRALVFLDEFGRMLQPNALAFPSQGHSHLGSLECPSGEHAVL